MTYATALWHHVQRSAMADLDLTWAEVQPDEDGDIVTVDVCIRLLVDEGWVRVWRVAASGLRPTVKLLREVNDHNVSLRGARVLLTDGGTLIVAGELRAESLEPGELGTLVRIVAECAEQVGPPVQIVYGSPSTHPASEEADR